MGEVQKVTMLPNGTVWPPIVSTPQTPEGSYATSRPSVLGWRSLLFVFGIVSVLAGTAALIAFRK